MRVHNVLEPVELFELDYCIVKPLDDDFVKRNQVVAAYEKALSAYEAENHVDAQAILATLLIDHPKDGPSLLLMLRVIQSQLGGSFDPVWTIPS